MLTDSQREKLKKNRLVTYEARMFEFEMDLAASKAVGDDRAVEEIEESIRKMKLAAMAVENL